MRSKIYIVEARNAAGELDSSNPPPFETASARQLQEFHDETTGDYMASLPAVIGWFKAQGWHCRQRDW